MALSIELSDLPTRTDVHVFLQRLERVGEPEVRLVVKERALAVFGATQAPQTLLDPLPAVLVMRAFALRETPTSAVDVTVPIRALHDRLARPGDWLNLALPDVTTTAAWAGVLPPVSGWEPAGSVDVASLQRVAREGSERIAQALPDAPGEAIVRTVREQVWGAEMLPGIVAGAAFAAEALGFLQNESHARVTRTRTWVRLSTGRGHTLLRQAMG